MKPSKNAKNRPRHEGSRPQVVAPAARRRRWPLVVISLVCVGAGGVLVERLTRPTGEEASTPPTMTEVVGERVGLTPPPRVRLSLDELVAEAGQLADELTRAFADEPRAWSLSARLTFMLGTPEKAQARWEHAVEMDPQLADAWLGMAELARKQGDLQQSVDYMRRMAQVNPQLAQEKVYILVDCLLKLGQAREVVDTLEKGGKPASLPGWAQVMLGQAYAQLQEFEPAAECYRRALSDPQQKVVAHYGLCQALDRLGRREEAQQVREAYVSLQEKNMEAFDRMQRAGTDEERHDPAAWHPILAQFHCEAGRLFAQRDQLDQARTHWLRAWALAPERPEPRPLLESLER